MLSVRAVYVLGSLHVTGQDLIPDDVANRKAIRCHQPQGRFKLGDPTDRDQVAPSGAILPQSDIQDGPRRTLFWTLVGRNWSGSLLVTRNSLPFYNNVFNLNVRHKTATGSNALPANLSVGGFMADDK
jgi:hypothetical protein